VHAKREDCHVSFGSRLPCERLTFQRGWNRHVPAQGSFSSILRQPQRWTSTCGILHAFIWSPSTHAHSLVVVVVGVVPQPTACAGDDVRRGARAAVVRGHYGRSGFEPGRCVGLVIIVGRGGGGNDGGGNDGGGGAATDGGRGERVNASPAPQFLRHSLLVLLGDKNSP